MAMPNENPQFNYGYIDQHVSHYPDGAAEPQGPPFMQLMVLSHYQSCVITRVLSDKTLAQEGLLLRIATITECQRIKAILKNDEYFLEYNHPRCKYEQESNASACRYQLNSSTHSFRTVEKTLQNQIELLQNQA